MPVDKDRSEFLRDYHVHGERIARDIHTRNFEAMLYKVVDIIFLEGHRVSYKASLEAMIHSEWIPVTITFNEKAPKGLKFLIELKGYEPKIMDHTPDAQELLLIFGLLRCDNRLHL